MKWIKKGLSTMAIVSAGFIASPITSAALYDGLYFNGFVGVSKPLNNKYLDDVGSNRYGLKSDHGFNVGAAAGYRFNCYRTEISLAYTENDDDRIDLTYNGTSSALAGQNTGDQKAITLMLNGYYDFVNSSGLVPFIGAGVGAAYVDHDYYYDSVNIRDNDMLFAYQLIVGVGSDITENLRVNLDYRFMATTKGDFLVNNGAGPFKVRGDYQNHQINLGLTYFI